MLKLHLTHKRLEASSALGWLWDILSVLHVSVDSYVIVVDCE